MANAFISGRRYPSGGEVLLSPPLLAALTLPGAINN